MKQGLFVITENRCIATDVFEMHLSGDTSDIIRPGQFVNILLGGLFLRRPISVCDCTDTEVVLVYKVVGKGTEKLSLMSSGDMLDVLTGLGNGFDISVSGKHPLLIGGGVGTPPLYLLARKLIESEQKVSVVLGFGSSGEVFYEKQFINLGCDVKVATVDGSYGEKGFVTDILPDEYSYYYAVGPEPMLKAVHKVCSTEGQLSFEERMGCGFGACMGCSCKTITGYKRICKDGPVMKKGEILWED